MIWYNIDNKIDFFNFIYNIIYIRAKSGTDMASRPFGSNDAPIASGDVVFVLQYSLDILQMFDEFFKCMMAVLMASGLNKRFHLVWVKDCSKGSCLIPHQGTPDNKAKHIKGTLPTWAGPILSGNLIGLETTNKVLRLIRKDRLDPDAFLKAVSKIVSLDTLTQWRKIIDDHTHYAMSDKNLLETSSGTYQMNNRMVSYGASGVSKVMAEIRKEAQSRKSRICRNSNDSGVALATALLYVHNWAEQHGATGVNIVCLCLDSPYMDSFTDEGRCEYETLEKILDKKVDFPKVVETVQSVHRIVFGIPDYMHMRAGLDLITTAVTPFPNVDAVVGRFDCVTNVMFILLNVFHMLTTGRPVFPVTDEQLFSIAEKLHCSSAEAEDIIRENVFIGTDFNRVYCDTTTLRKTLTPTVFYKDDIKFHNAVVNAYIRVAKFDPRLLLFMMSHPFFRSKSQCEDDPRNKYGKVISTMAPHIRAVYEVVFAGQKVNNDHMLAKLSNLIPDKMAYDAMVVAYTGDIITAEALEKLTQFSPDDRIADFIRSIKYKVMPLRDAIGVGPQVHPDRRLYLPVDSMDDVSNFQFLLGLSTANCLIPGGSACFKLALILMTQGVKLQFGIKSMAQQYVQGNLGFVEFLRKDFKPVKGKNPMQAGSWYTQQINVLAMLLQAFHVIECDKDTIDRVTLLMRLLITEKALTEKIGWTVELDGNSKTSVTAGAYRLCMCKNGNWVPETLMLNSDTCVYCVGTHEYLTDEGRERQRECERNAVKAGLEPWEHKFKPSDRDVNKRAHLNYHDDGTRTVEPNFGDVYIDRDAQVPTANVRCSRCKCRYNILDNARRGSALRCYNCRRGAIDQVAKAPIVQCSGGCAQKFVFGAKPPDGWQCVYCEHGQDKFTELVTCSAQASPTVLQLATINRDTIINILSKRVGIKRKLVNCVIEYALKDKRLTLSKFVRKMVLPNASRLIISKEEVKPADVGAITLPDGIRLTGLRSDWPKAMKRTKAGLTLKHINADKVADQLSLIGHKMLRDKCCIGSCGDRNHSLTDMINPCNKCTLMTCADCFYQTISLDRGQVASVLRFRCPCGAPVAPEALVKLGQRGTECRKLIEVATKECVAGNTRYMMARCCGANHPRPLRGAEATPDPPEWVNKCARNCNVIVIKPPKMACGVEQDYSNVTMFRCPDCVTANLAHREAMLDYHRRRTIGQYDRDNEMVFTHMLKQGMLDNANLGKVDTTIYRLCPGCNVVVYRPSGCDHMNCTRCGTDWNWDTRSKNVYDNYDYW